MDQFISGMDTSRHSILSNTSQGNIEITSTNGVTNSNIVIRNLENRYRVGFYVPTVLLANGNEERTEAFVVYRKFYVCCSSSVEATVFSYGAYGIVQVSTVFKNCNSGYFGACMYFTLVSNCKDC